MDATSRQKLSISETLFTLLSELREEAGDAHTHADTYTYTQVQGDVLRIWREVRLKLH